MDISRFLACSNFIKFDKAICVKYGKSLKNLYYKSSGQNNHARNCIIYVIIIANDIVRELKKLQLRI